MQALHKVGDNPYDDKEISLGELCSFAVQHLARILADAVAPEAAVEIAAVENALDGLEVKLSDDTLTLGLSKSRVAAKERFRRALPNELSRLDGAATRVYGDAGSERKAVFPGGLSIYQTCDDAALGGHLTALHTAFADRADALGAEAEELAESLRDQWATLFAAKSEAKGKKAAAAHHRRTAAQALKDALGLLRLRLGQLLFKKPDRLKALFPQHLLGFPVGGKKARPAEAAAEEAAPKASLPLA